MNKKLEEFRSEMAGWVHNPVATNMIMDQVRSLVKEAYDDGYKKAKGDEK